MSVKQFVRLISMPQPGEPMLFRLIGVDRRLNAALIQMEKNVFRAMGINR